VQKLPKNPVIGIVGGRGVLGRIFRKAFETAGCEVKISGRKPDGKKILSNKNLVKVSDVVMVSVFLKDTEKVIRELAPLLSSRQLFVDLASLKSGPVTAMLESKAEVVGLHPMFGAVENLCGKNIFACPARGKKWWQWLRKILEDSGLKIHEISPQKHDELAAIHQAAAHLLNLAFAQLLKKQQISPAKLFEIASPSTQLFLLTSGRILNQDLEMYTDIQLANPAAKKTAMALAKIFGELANEVAGGKRAKLLRNFEEASKFFGRWKDFAEKESERIFEKISGKEELTPKISQRLISANCKLKTANCIAIFGQNTQTELAATKFLQEQKLELPFNSCGSIAEVFEKVCNGRAKIGFIPLENFSIGPVRETMRALFESGGKIKIFAEISKKIEHALFATEKISLKKIRKVFAHPQAVAQSAKFLQRNLPQAEIIEAANAGEAIERARSERAGAAISSAEFAEKARMKVLRRGIEDSKNNRTRFVAICKNFPKSKVQYPKSRTSIAFFFRENRAGQLAAALQIFAEGKINLSRIESIPTEKKRGEFFFFVECEMNPKLSAVLKKLSKIASVVELGSY